MATNVDRVLSRGPFRENVEPAPDPERDAWIERIEKAISAKAFTQAQKNELWRHIKTSHPELVEFLNNPLVKELIAAGATPAFPPELIRATRNAAKQVTQ